MASSTTSRGATASVGWRARRRRPSARNQVAPRGCGPGERAQRKRVQAQRDDRRRQPDEDGDGGEVRIEAALGRQPAPPQQVGAGECGDHDQGLERDAHGRQARHERLVRPPGHDGTPRGPDGCSDEQGADREHDPGHEQRREQLERPAGRQRRGHVAEHAGRHGNEQPFHRLRAESLGQRASAAAQERNRLRAAVGRERGEDPEDAERDGKERDPAHGEHRLGGPPVLLVPGEDPPQTRAHAEPQPLSERRLAEGRFELPHLGGEGLAVLGGDGGRIDEVAPLVAQGQRVDAREELVVLVARDECVPEDEAHGVRVAHGSPAEPRLAEPDIVPVASVEDADDVEREEPALLERDVADERVVGRRADEEPGRRGSRRAARPSSRRARSRGPSRPTRRRTEAPRARPRRSGPPPRRCRRARRRPPGNAGSDTWSFRESRPLRAASGSCSGSSPRSPGPHPSPLARRPGSGARGRRPARRRRRPGLLAAPARSPPPPRWRRFAPGHWRRRPSARDCSRPSGRTPGAPARRGRRSPRSPRTVPPRRADRSAGGVPPR